MNYTSDTKIDYYGGATTISTPAMKNAVTLGNYIAGNPNLKADPSNYLFQHEFGHYLQSKKYGPAYFSRVTVPSLKTVGSNKHDFNRVEQDANARAIGYFQKRGVLDWKFKKNPIGSSRTYWDMSNIYDSKGNFTHEFQDMLSHVKIKSSVYDYLSFVGGPLSIYFMGNANYNVFREEKHIRY